jgi:hypothetical protein
VKHDGFMNKYSFVLNQRPITLVPLSPKQVHEDQVRMQKESDASQGAGHANHTHGNGAEFEQDPLSLPGLAHLVLP